MAFKADDSAGKAQAQLTRQALFNLRFNQLRERNESTQYISLYTPTIDSSSDSSQLREDDAARILALELERAMAINHASSSVSSTEASRQRRIRVREKYNQLAPMATRIPQYVRPRTETTPDNSRSSQRTSTSQHTQGVRYYKLPPPGQKSATSGQSLDDSTWRHSAEFRRLKEERLETAKLRQETQNLFGMNAFSEEPDVDWDKEDELMSSAQGPSAVPDVFPPHRLVDNAAELGTYLASSSYVISLGGPPLPELKYGIIIVPAHEEQLLFSGYGDHAAMPAEVKNQVYSKSKAFQREHERMLRQQAAEEAASEIESDPELDDNEKEFYRRRWLIRTGRPTEVKQDTAEIYRRTWLIHTGGSAASDDHDKREPIPEDKPQRVMSAPLPRKTGMRSSESETEVENPGYEVHRLPTQSSLPDTADYDDKTTEESEPQPQPEAHVPKVNIDQMAKTHSERAEEMKAQLAQEDAPTLSETNDRECFREPSQRTAASPDCGLKPSEDDTNQVNHRGRKVLEQRGVEASNSQIEDDASKQRHQPETAQEIAPIPVPNQTGQLVAEKEASVESSGSQTSRSSSFSASTETDATSNHSPADTNITGAVKANGPLQPKDPVMISPTNDTTDRSISRKACNPLRFFLKGNEKRQEKHQIPNSVLPGPRVKSPLPRRLAKNRNARLDVVKVITGLTYSDHNQSSLIDSRLRKTADVGLGSKPARTQNKAH